ncbi:transporter [Ganoderma sinense ZZ0214-1]|uniref:Transporter n=1 Tax=Ganoderma sinense ZZ0214-1 TaxID=1077348 RepID=A0A2G8RQN6_9APHY|nr:transporter [Ganoderma sinense ZZ0214-1]
MPSSLYVPILIGGMLLTGSTNSLWSKWQDMQCVENCDDPNPAKRILYEQPVWQTLQMFFGEMLCFLPVVYSWLRSGRQSQPLALPADSEEEPADGAKSEIPHAPLDGWKVLLMWFPAACDLTGTTLMNVGLLYAPVSIYQMTRGALVLFVGVLSVIFLRRRLWLYQLSSVLLPTYSPLSSFLWISLVTVMAGVSLVGLSGSMIKDSVKEPNVSALEELPQSGPVEDPELTKVLVATQFVIEEKIMARYTVAPLVAVGLEGFFGALSIVLAMPILARYASISPFFDLPRGWHQMIDTPSVLYSGIVIAFSISLFNFFGLSLTRHVSATVRSLTDTCRTITIWIVSLGLGWEVLVWPISLLQVAGFGLLVYGTFMFNHLVAPPSFLRPPTEANTPPNLDQSETQTLLADEALEDTAVLPSDLGLSGFDVVPPQEHETHAHNTRRPSQG